ncbi:MAG: sugar phosphate isomerase/epimerase [Bauldia sp.]
MKIGFCMLLWTGHVTRKHRKILEDLKATGYDGVQIPIFEGEVSDYEKIGRMLDEIGLEACGIAVFPTLKQNPLSDKEADRKRALKHLQWIIDCTSAMNASQVAGPLHQTIGHFTGHPPTKVEKSRARELHKRGGDYAAERNVQIVLEAINRFECYFMNTMDDLSAYLDTVKHPAVTGMYDTFHANLEEKDPVAAYNRNYRNFAHVHISENDRGVPGTGHVPWAATFKAIKSSGYDGWLTIEAFGRALPELAAATRVWRDLHDRPEDVYRIGYRTIRDGWAAA